MNNKKDRIITIRIAPEMERKLLKRVKKEQTTVSDFTRMLYREYFEWKRLC